VNTAIIKTFNFNIGEGGYENEGQLFIYLCIFEAFTPVFRVMFKVYISY